VGDCLIKPFAPAHLSEMMPKEKYTSTVGAMMGLMQQYTRPSRKAAVQDSRWSVIHGW
jgi:hypothetical protein